MKMGVSDGEFESFEQQLLDLLGEFQSITSLETRLRECMRNEATRAEAAEAARDAAQRAAAEARNGAAAAAASANQAATALAKAHNESTALKLQWQLADRQRTLLEEKCKELSNQVVTLEREVQQLRPLQLAQPALQRQYTELQERIRVAANDAQSEASRLESELRRVERCASGGSELRERARLAAAAHARERRLAAAELQHTSRELLRANAEAARLGELVEELRHRLSQYVEEDAKTKEPNSDDTLSEVRGALEAEKAGSMRLERALTAALADNATLAAKLHSVDNALGTSQPSPSPSSTKPTNICPLDSFLAE